MSDRCIIRGTQLDSFKVLQGSWSPELGNSLAGMILQECLFSGIKKKIDRFILNEMKGRDTGNRKIHQTRALSIYIYIHTQYLLKKVQFNSCTQEIYNDPLCAP